MPSREVQGARSDDRAAGVKFTYGTNNMVPDDLSSLEYGMKLAEECQFKIADFWYPKDN